MARSERAGRTFTIGFGGDADGFLDERPYAAQVSARYGDGPSRARSLEPEIEDALNVGARLRRTVRRRLARAYALICELTRRHVTVALTGLGGDENFAGYQRYLGLQLSLLTQRWPLSFLTRLARPLVRRLREEESGHYRINHLKRFVEAADLSPARRWQGYQAIFSQAERRLLYTPSIARDIDFDAVDAAGGIHSNGSSPDPLDRAMYQDIKMFLPDDILALTDRVGMWHSLELRVPFTDHKLMEFCARLPVSLKLRRGEKKHLLRRAASAYLPPSVSQPSQAGVGFITPMARWLEGTSVKEFSGKRFLAPDVLADAGVL